MLKEKELYPEPTKSSTQVRYSDTMLKEKALSFLFASFSQKSNFIGSALKIQMIYEPALARLMYDAWAKVRMLAYFAKDLGSNNEEKRKAALSWCSNQLQEWTSLLAVTAKTPIKASTIPHACARSHARTRSSIDSFTFDLVSICVSIL
jgi:hypothetical protein